MVVCIARYLIAYRRLEAPCESRETLPSFRVLQGERKRGTFALQSCLASRRSVNGRSGVLGFGVRAKLRALFGATPSFDRPPDTSAGFWAGRGWIRGIEASIGSTTESDTSRPTLGSRRAPSAPVANCLSYGHDRKLPVAAELRARSVPPQVMRRRRSRTRIPAAARACVAGSGMMRKSIRMVGL